MRLFAQLHNEKNKHFVVYFFWLWIFNQNSWNCNLSCNSFFIYIAYEILGYTDLKFSIIFFLLLFFYSFYAVKDSESEFKNKDPRQIVIDEVLGQSMPLILMLYLNQTNQISISIEIYYILSFLFFRFFDILNLFR